MSEEKIAAAKDVIANSKRKLTLFTNFLETYSHEDDFNKLEKWKDRVEISYNEFEKAQNEIEVLEGEFDIQQAARNEFDRKYFEAWGKATSLSNSNSLNQTFDKNNPESLGSGNINNASREVHHRNQIASLPRVNLPSFSGTFDTWLGFRDLFQSIIEKDTHLRDIGKLYYLKGCLKGAAADLIESIEMTSENYRVAWELLEERYNNPKFIRQTHVQTILNISSITKEFPVRMFLDVIQKNIRSLEALKEPVDKWDTLLVEIVKNKLGSLREKWEEYSCDFAKLTYKELITFLQRRAQFEDTRSQTQTRCQGPLDKRLRPQSCHTRQQQVYSVATKQGPCSHCQGEHFIYSCDKFKRLASQERFEFAKQASLCINCLRPNHRVLDCTATPCRRCHKKHNRSQANFITEKIANFLNLPRRHVDVTVSGVEGICTGIKHSVTATLKSRFNKFQKQLEFYVFSRITQRLPSASLSKQSFDIPKNIYLADPEFHKAAEVDILLGVKHFFKLLCVGQIELKNHPEAVLQKTQLGWIVAGEINSQSFAKRNVQCNFIKNVSSLNFVPNETNLETNLAKFWEIEEVPTTSKTFSDEEKACEEHFRNNIDRTAEGRYVVRLPFKENRNGLGESYVVALNRFKLLENRFRKNPALKVEYSKCLDDYEALNHMSVLEKRDSKETGFFLPHHAVIKKDSLTTRTRVVFDGSAKSSTGLSLNDTLMVGPTIQSDLFSLLSRFRTHPIALIADLEKMYRQILVHPEDTCYQKILFRNNVDKPIQTFSLNTVTFGTSCAPFLAIRTLIQLAQDEGKQHPTAATCLENDFYADDLISGAKTREEALFLQRDLTQLLSKGGFSIRKWASNDPSVTQIENSIQYLSLDPNSTIKTLGILWNPSQDKILYSVDLSNGTKQITKRSILSQVAKLFDPLGLLGPVIIKAKIIIQMLWKAGVSWDGSVPLNIHTLWEEFKNELPLLSQINFDRLILAPNSVEIQLHGFCDASEKAYGACIYLLSIDAHGNHFVSFVCSKSRVAPLKTLSLPRLELLAALLLSRLYLAIKNALHLKFTSSHLWSDSMIVLHWINMEPYQLKTFVANRITEVKELTRSCKWRHVPTHDNPADLISRGQMPTEFLKSTLWKDGPFWLKLGQEFWPKNKLKSIEILERKSLIALPVSIKRNLVDIVGEEMIHKKAKFDKLVKLLAYIFRFIFNLKASKTKQSKDQGHLRETELEKARLFIIRGVQSEEFAKEIQFLSRGFPLEAKNRLSPLTPFVDQQGVLRVGGRLAKSEWPFEKKHQILLPAKHSVTNLIIRDEHRRLQHAGAQTTLYSIRERYWIIDGRNMIRKEIRNCFRCVRINPRSVEYLMGNLPQERIAYSRPFLNVGVDYCGPLYIKEKRFRNRKKLKVYVAIFICIGSKTVHLELVSDATTEAFISCLKRLFSRRGMSKTINSNNGRNFVGASREIIELYNLFQSKEHNEKIKQFLEQQKIVWKFSPPLSPHFGGLWEAAVKSFKHHLIRTVGDSQLTFEQLETCIIEIEAILNSRPISPMSSDPNDLQPLTPGHFLIGAPLTSLPQHDFSELPSNRLSSWQLAQKMRQHFWKRWQKEYLNELNIRNKWKDNSTHGIKPGTMVVVREDNAPPLQWEIGRVIEAFPGSDGVIRVVKIRTPKGEYTRCIKRLCILPIESSENCKPRNDET